MFIRNHWYGALWSQDLGESPVTRRILDTPLVLYRASEGAVAVLDGVCPHRFAPLHLGKVVDGNRIRCPYHGLEFDQTGTCVRNPHTTGRIPPAARVNSYTAVERHGMVWVWLGDRKADPDLIPDYSFLDEADPRHVSTFEWLEIAANYRLVVDNLLDLSHVCVLHEGVLGNDDMMDAEITVEDDGGDLVVRRTMTDVSSPTMFDLMYMADQRRIDTFADIRLMGVSTLRNHVGVNDAGKGRDGGTALMGAHILTPIDETRTLYHFCAVRINPPIRSAEDDLAIRQEVIKLRNYAFSQQDAVIMEAQQAALRDPAVDTSRPALFDIDVGASRFARRIEAMLAAD